MVHFSDDLYLGNARLTPNDPNNPELPANGWGVGPLGRIYIWDTVPLAVSAGNISAPATIAAAGNLVLTAGTNVTRGVNNRGETVTILDVPRAVSITAAAGAATRNYTVTGYDYTGQKMSELIPNVTASSTVAGKKAFKQILTIAVDGGTVANVSASTTDVLGIPVRSPSIEYVIAVHYNSVQAVATVTYVAADGTNPATASTGDVRGTMVPPTPTDGVKRLVAALAMPAIAVGPNATRAGAFGVDQNLSAQ